jgi:hypothetical protein
MSGAAVKQAGEEIKRQILDMASSVLSLPADDLECEDGVVFSKSRQGKTLTFAEVARKHFVLKGPLLGKGAYTPPKLGGSFKGAAVGTSPAYSFGAQVGEVAIDEETGEITVVGIWDVHDCGRINPRLLAVLRRPVHGNGSRSGRRSCSTTRGGSRTLSSPTTGCSPSICRRSSRGGRQQDRPPWGSRRSAKVDQSDPGDVFHAIFDAMGCG